MRELDVTSQLKKYDISGMAEVLDHYVEQCREALLLGERFSPTLPPEIDQLLVCGMGGSAMAGEIARRFARIPVHINRNYVIPPFVNSSTLLAAVSYSGNTAETLSGLQKGLALDLPALAISSGGKLMETAQVNGIPFLRIPAGYQPRAATGYLALPLLVVLERAGLLAQAIDRHELLESLAKVKELCHAGVPEKENPAKQLARRLHRTIPVIYGTADNTGLVAMRWKTQINENAKQPAFWNVVPELNHNEILSFENEGLRKGLYCIFLKNDYDHPENIARIQIMRELLEEKEVSTEVVQADGTSEISQVLSQIYFGDYVSYYLAILNGIDPTPVELIESFKKKLAQR